MRDDHQLAPSLPLARHENAHREHAKHQNHALRHQHNHRDATATATATTTAEAAVVTQVTATISVVQQVDVDSNGSTLSVFAVPQTSSNENPEVLTDSSSPTTISPTTAAASSNAASGAVFTALNTPAQTSSLPPSSPLSSSPTALAALTSASSSSIIAGSNSTTLISSSSGLSSTSADPTSISSSLSSSLSAKTPLVYLTSSSGSSTLYDVSSTITSLSSSSSSGAFRSTSFQSTSTGAFGGAVGGTALTSSTAASTTATSVNGNDSNSGSPVTTRAVVGGVVGSVAGVAVIALLLLILIKWRKNPHGALLSLGSGRDGAGDGADAGTRDPLRPSGGMVERRSFAHAFPAALASLTGYQRSSRQTDQTVTSAGTGERGFYRVSGRKLPSVLQTGGDGYGGGVLDDHTLSGSSFYRDSQGFYGGPGTPPFPPLETERESGRVGTPVMRPSPARTPVTEQGRFSTAGAPDLIPPSPRPDLHGRSRPSQDGSHASRFTEEV